MRNRVVLRRMIFVLVLLMASALLFVLLVRVNAESPRCTVSELAFPLPEDGPVLLTGGELVRTGEKETEYQLRLIVDEEAFLYFPRTGNAAVNGDPDAVEQTYGGAICRLTPDGETGGDYLIALRFQDENPSKTSTAVYIGTYGQIVAFLNTSAMVNYYVQGLCFAVMLLCAVLFIFKQSERYLIWLALLAFFRGSYYRLFDLLSLLSWIPGIQVLMGGVGYLIATELLAAFLQYQIMKSFGPVKIFGIAFPLLAAAASLPVFVLYRNSGVADLFSIVFYAVLFGCYLVCFLNMKQELAAERTLLLLTCAATALLRFFDEFCVIGLIPSGDVNMKIRLRGIISILFVVAFFVVAGKRFAQKFQEADDLNEHLEAEIRKKAKQQTLFVRSMLHNLKTPMFSLSGYSEMALHSLDRSPEQARGYMEKAREKAILAGEMMDRIFLVTQMDSDMVQMQRTPVHMEELLRAVAETPTAGEETKHLTLQLKLLPDVYVMGDQLYLRQAFQNLLDNARINTPDGGTVTLRMEADESRLTVHVSDTGCGIRKEDLERVFDAYYSDRHGKQQSSGLGLYICREIIRRHGGSIRVISREGEGADFQVELPLPSENT